MKQDTKRLLLEKGLEILTRKGFNNTGIQEVLSAVGVPKGSFYHYFKSKEDFGLQVVDYYAQTSIDRMDRFMKDEAFPPLERLRRFFENAVKEMKENEFCGGCFIGNMSQEMGDLSESFEKKLERKWQASRSCIAHCLIAARQAGDLKLTCDADDLADFLLNAWQGALMRMKVTKSADPLELYLQIVFVDLLK
ncbi:TetR family transcriptional regulator C-terminal domain-containing protein [Sulfidibacter corallicola]|uniref:TetR family transcriptional regulator C-terminal domain-containing protein n=1 Tax=Sulfidibacter corallicola TaxID=2818388 RepID=A0A8A4TQD0_SULCO|nr:TetR/AcrR family transcriptional regulator [Sulfidibacter corallicola]QTD51292.1 TetR family transcriptional regulator C-terminal domain-containing protein [Sulfidibacter corallicola]